MNFRKGCKKQKVRLTATFFLSRNAYQVDEPIVI